MGGNLRVPSIAGNAAGDIRSDCEVVERTSSSKEEVKAEGLTLRAAAQGSGYAVWPLSALSAFVGISGIYGLHTKELINHFDERGLYRGILWSVMEAGYTGSRMSEALPRSSPTAMINGDVTAAFAWQKGAGMAPAGAAALLPPCTLIHG